MLVLCVFPHISRSHHIIAEVASQLVSRDVGEQRGSRERGCRPGRRGGQRRSRRTGRGGVWPCTLTDGAFLQAVAHHNKCVEAQSGVYHELWRGRQESQRIMVEKGSNKAFDTQTQSATMG